MRADELTRRGFLASTGVVLASAAVSLVSGPVAALAEGAQGGERDSGKIVIVHTNDVHCKLRNDANGLGYAALVDYVNVQRREFDQDNVTLVDCGDFLQGEVSGALSFGEYPAATVASCGFDVMCVGNHEFDYGMERFELLSTALGQTPLVSCNFYDTRNSSRVLDAYRIFEYQVGGSTVRIAFVGVTTPDAMSTSSPASFQDGSGNKIYEFCGDATGERLYDVVQKSVDEARAQGADYVVLLAHLGQWGSVERWRSDAVVAHTRGIDLVLDGHSHQVLAQTSANADGQSVMIAQAGSSFGAIGRVVLDPAAGTASATVTATGLGVTAEHISSWTGSDPDVEKIVTEVYEEIEQTTSEVLGASEVELVSLDADGTWALRARETNLGDFCADSLLHYARTKGMSCDVALVAGGCIRSGLDVGQVTAGGLINVFPYFNKLLCLEVSGQHLLDMLEVGARNAPQGCGGFLQVSEGFHYTVATGVDTPVVLVEDGSGLLSISGQRRVSNVTLNGVAVDPQARYTVVCPSYTLVEGGDCMPVPDGASDAVEVDLDIAALASYLCELGGVVGDGYRDAAGAGRIELVDHVEPVDDDKPKDDSEPLPVVDRATDVEPDSRGGGSVPATGDGSAAGVAAVAVAGIGAFLAAGGAAAAR